MTVTYEFNIFTAEQKRKYPDPIAIFLLTFSMHVQAQSRDGINLPDHDDKFYHLGIALIYNNSHFQVTPHPNLMGERQCAFSKS